MAEVVGKVPEFTTDETPEGGVPEVQQEHSQEIETTLEEKETPASPPEEKPAEENREDTPAPSHDLERAVQGLQEERAKLLQEITQLRGQKREIKQDQVQKIDEKLDELKDLHPEDVNVIDKVLRAKGYMTRGEADQMFYEAVKNEELNKFLEKYPEYKPENDRSDTNWQLLQNEFALYRRPDNPRLISELLERAHRSIVRVPSERNLPAQKRQIETASKGSGGVQRSSSTKSLDPVKRAQYERGGWSEEEIKKIEERL